MAALARLNSPLECLRAPFLFNPVIRGSNKIVYEHNEGWTCLLHSLTKVLGLSADYDPFRTIKVLDHPSIVLRYTIGHYPEWRVTGMGPV